jgi:hypothetical protein
VEKAFSIPSTEIWIPTVEELMAAHVITDVSDKFGTRDGDKIPANLAEQMLGENPLKILKTQDPGRYKALNDRLTLAMTRYARQPNAEPLPSSELAPLSLFYLSHASDALAVEFGRAFQAYLVKLDKANPDECYFIAYPEKAPMPFAASEIFSGDELASFADLQVRLVSDGAQRNAAAPTKREIEPAWNAMEKEFLEKYPGVSSPFDTLESPTADHGAACTALTQILATILALSGDQSGPLLRYLFGSY